MIARATPFDPKWLAVGFAIAQSSGHQITVTHAWHPGAAAQTHGALAKWRGEDEAFIFPDATAIVAGPRRMAERAS